MKLPSTSGALRRPRPSETLTPSFVPACYPPWKVVEIACLPDNRPGRLLPRLLRKAAVLEIKVLGDLQVLRDGTATALPPSRKTRALLAYLALTRHPHRREQLCEMFWDVPRSPACWRIARA